MNEEQRKFFDEACIAIMQAQINRSQVMVDANALRVFEARAIESAQRLLEHRNYFIKSQSK